MYKLDDHIACAVAGLTGTFGPVFGARYSLLMLMARLAADANILINSCRLAAQRYNMTYQEPMPVEQLVQTVCDTKQVR